MSEATKDVFISHASDDKEKIVRPLVKVLDQERISYWYDEDEIDLGDTITKKVNEGLSNSRFVVVVLSPAFMQKGFPQAELHAALHEQASTGKVRILPILAGSDQERQRILNEIPLIKSTAYVSWNDDPKHVVDMILRRLRPESKSLARVCFISSEYPPRVFGGLGIHVQELTRALGTHIDVDIVLPKASRDKYKSSSARVHITELANANATYDEPVSWLRFADFAAERIVRMARANRPSAIHCHDWVTILAGVKCKWLLDIPLVFHLHLPNRSVLCASVENLGLVCADLITVNSEAMSQDLSDRRLLLRSVEVIKNGVDRDLFKPCDDWPDDDGYVLFVGRLVEQKGVEYLLRAFYYVREKFPDARLKIAGEGPYQEALERLSTNLMLSPQVEFLGWKTGPELARLYQKARVVVVPSIYEPFGMTALEALACKRAVVASDVGGLAEIVQHKTTGFLAEPKDELDLAQWLMTLLANADLRNQMGEAGCAFVLNGGYTWPAIADQYIKLYKTLQGKPVDRTIPKRAAEFRDQIRSVARELAPVLRQGDYNVLDKLFSWMDSPA
jgi:glycosyltransferase involved in cell wall biosynthesis